MKLGQSQHDAGFIGYSVEEKSVKIGCRKKVGIELNERFVASLNLPLAECNFLRFEACPVSLDLRSCLRASCSALRDSGWNTFSFLAAFCGFSVGAMSIATFHSCAVAKKNQGLDNHLGPPDSDHCTRRHLRPATKDPLRRQACVKVLMSPSAVNSKGSGDVPTNPYI